MPEKVPSHDNHHLVEQYRFNFFSPELSSIAHATALTDLMITGESFRNVLESAMERGVWWLDVANLSEKELNSLSKILLAHWTTKNTQTPRSRGKVKPFIENQYRVFCFRSVLQMDEDYDGYVKTQNLYLVVFQKGILSFADCQSLHAINVMRKAAQLRDCLVPNRGWMFYALL